MLGKKLIEQEPVNYLSSLMIWSITMKLAEIIDTWARFEIVYRKLKDQDNVDSCQRVHEFNFPIFLWRKILVKLLNL